MGHTEVSSFNPNILFALQHTRFRREGSAFLSRTPQLVSNWWPYIHGGTKLSSVSCCRCSSFHGFRPFGSLLTAPIFYAQASKSALWPLLYISGPLQSVWLPYVHYLLMCSQWDWHPVKLFDLLRTLLAQLRQNDSHWSECRVPTIVRKL